MDSSDLHDIAAAAAITALAERFYEISIVYRRLDNGKYEVDPILKGNPIVVLPSNLCETIIEQIAAFMTSPLFIQDQVVRLRVHAKMAV